MALDPNVKQFLQFLEELDLPPLEELSPEQVRERKMPVLGPIEPVHEIRALQIPTRTADLNARLYVPKLEDSKSTTPLPVVAFIHGGGWVLGDLDGYEQLCCALANQSRCAVVSFEYRLAPEYPFPEAVHQCVDGVRWLLENQLSSSPNESLCWQTDPTQLVVMGDSAGGNLATVVAQELNQAEPHPLCGQVLVYPITDSDFSRPSFIECNEGYYLTPSMMEWFWDHYCPDQTVRIDPRLSPIRAENLSGLPDTYLLTCQYDPLRDEGNCYAQELISAGVSVDHHEVPGFIHGFIRQLHTFSQARESLSQIARWIKKRVTTR